MKIVYAVFAAAVLALSFLHMATTFRLSSSPVAKLWFFGTGMALALGAVLNFLNQRYGRGAFGLRAASIGANLLLFCFAAVAGRVTRASAIEQVLMLTLLIGTLILSALPSASFNTSSPRHEHD